MSDLIERLRNPPCDEQWTHGGLFDEAADEIERLNAELTHHKGKAEVWEDAARAAQARVEALEGALEKIRTSWNKYGWDANQLDAAVIADEALAATEQEGE